MPTNRVPLRRRVRGELTSDMEMALWLGVGRNGFPFADEDEVEELWTRHRERIMADHARNGRRPQAWWWFEAPPLGLDYPGYETEASYLYEHGQLGAEESASVVAYWREQFGRCHEPGFTLCMGEGQWLRGREARLAHYRWADIPASLVERWTRERVIGPAGFESATASTST